jgi:hypothetical protein
VWTPAFSWTFLRLSIALSSSASVAMTCPSSLLTVRQLAHAWSSSLPIFSSGLLSSVSRPSHSASFRYAGTMPSGVLLGILRQVSDYRIFRQTCQMVQPTRNLFHAGVHFGELFFRNLALEAILKCLGIRFPNLDSRQHEPSRLLREVRPWFHGRSRRLGERP